MLKLSETYRAMTCEYGWGKKKTPSELFQAQFCFAKDSLLKCVSW